MSKLKINSPSEASKTHQHFVGCFKISPRLPDPVIYKLGKFHQLVHQQVSMDLTANVTALTHVS